MLTTILFLAFNVPFPAPPPEAEPPPVVRAPRATDATKDHQRIASAAYDLGYYDIAARQYEQVYTATLDPTALFNAAESYRLATNLKKARVVYLSYIRIAPDGGMADTAASRLEEIDRALYSKTHVTIRKNLLAPVPLVPPAPKTSPPLPKWIPVTAFGVLTGALGIVIGCAIR